MITYIDIIPDAELRKRWLLRYKAMIARCHNQGNKDYPRYGGRGIFVYEPWRLDRREFLEWIIKQAGWDDPELQLDRLDNFKGYYPNNLEFKTAMENSNNRRSNTKMFYFDKIFTMAEFLRKFCPALNPGTLHRYLARGWTGETICKHYLKTNPPTPLEQLCANQI